MASRTSLIEQKRIQWAKEREEMTRLGGSWGLMKQSNSIRTIIRTYPAGARISLAEMKDKPTPSQTLRAGGHYGSTLSLKSLANDSIGNGSKNLKCLDYNSGSLISLHDHPELSQIRRRSPSLPPIYNKEQGHYICQTLYYDDWDLCVNRYPVPCGVSHVKETKNKEAHIILALKSNVLRWTTINPRNRYKRSSRSVVPVLCWHSHGIHYVHIYTSGIHNSIFVKGQKIASQSREVLISSQHENSAGSVSLFDLQDQQKDFGIEGLRYHPHKLTKQHHHRRRSCDRDEDQKENHYSLHGEERGGETSGYASDSVDVPVIASARILPSCKQSRIEMNEKTWQNPYCTTPESSLPPSRRLSDGRIGELNRPRWGGIWGQETARGDPPPPSWLARLGHSSQVLVINHDSASSPDSSTTCSTGSEVTKTYLRGQNLPVDADILHEREARRQKAMELQNAIKQQLEDKDRQKREEKERRMREERLEEERIKREQERERERFEEEQRKLKEKEVAKLKQAEAMREVLQAAERLAKEEKRNRWKREESDIVQSNNQSKTTEPKAPINNTQSETCTNKTNQHIVSHKSAVSIEEKGSPNKEKEENNRDYTEVAGQTTPDVKSLQVPISKDVAIVLSGRLEDTEAFNKANLQLVNLVVTPSPRAFDSNTNNFSLGINAVMRGMGSPILGRSSSRLSPSIVENRLLTPSKYRTSYGRDFGTQTDIESDLQELQEKMQESTLKEQALKERKDTTNAGRRDVEKSTNGGRTEDSPVKTLQRSKSQPRTSIQARPRWNANRPGTRYRTQSEKDPHYQMRMRMRRRQIESSDERSRSPSLDRRKSNNTKSKIRNVNRRRAKVDHYDADLSMDSLNSIIPLRIDKNGRINLEDNKCLQNIEKAPLENNAINEADDVQRNQGENTNVWCGEEILSKLSSLKNGLLVKQIEWDSERCLVSPAASEFY